jgi:predicted transcriptional regulator
MSEEFAQQIIHQAVARACIALDYKTSYSSVVETLSDVVIKYIQDLSEETKEVAESSGRAVVGVQDVLRILTEKVIWIFEISHFTFYPRFT